MSEIFFEFETFNGSYSEFSLERHLDRIAASFVFAVDYFNERVFGWEPLLEPWRVQHFLVTTRPNNVALELHAGMHFFAFLFMEKLISNFHPTCDQLVKDDGSLWKYCGWYHCIVSVALTYGVPFVCSCGKSK